MSERLAAVYNMAPADVLDFGATLDPTMLASGETIVSVTWTVDAADAAAGLELTDLGLETDATYGQVGYARVSITAGAQSHERFDGAGVVLAPRAKVVTSLDMEVERQLPIRVSRGVAAAETRSQRVLVIGAEP